MASAAGNGSGLFSGVAAILLDVAAFGDLRLTIFSLGAAEADAASTIEGLLEPIRIFL